MLLSVSERTVYRRMSIYGLRKHEFSLISVEELDNKVEKITNEFPSCGENIKYILSGNETLRESLHRVDQQGIARQSNGKLHEEFKTCGMPISCGMLTLIINLFVGILWGLGNRWIQQIASNSTMF